jgi:predicted transcriptional regulator
MATKVTLTLDDPTIRRLQSASERLNKSKSAVVRDAITDSYEDTGRLSEAERHRQLRVIRELAPTIPPRPASEVEKEIREIRLARRGGGRGGTSRGPR